MHKPVLYGFDGSTYVRTVRMLLAEKNATYDQVPVDVLAGEPRQPEHLARHPFGKVPVLDHDGMRLLETSAITRYLDAVLPGPSFIPGNARDRARMDMAIGLIDAYGYGCLIGAVAAYHLFPDLVGGVGEQAREEGIARSKLVLGELMKIRDGSPFIAGDGLSLADFFLAPICFYIALTPDANAVFDVPAFGDWWQCVQGLPSYKSTEPDLG
ncbi:glutathione S-transferase [Modicisalibacter muralis]|uniref:Glutathione S-transferase n=1 Tax=Modicisalibacter muralis TaxID=119000 RepID=A0A1G9NIZ8_9GAMM|nr:glutathione S-transferase family protein [Halomonas muralis]SDL86576.1 glutathione S-transferase [Halomonas muralis]